MHVLDLPVRSKRRPREGNPAVIKSPQKRSRLDLAGATKKDEREREGDRSRPNSHRRDEIAAGNSPESVRREVRGGRKTMRVQERELRKKEKEITGKEEETEKIRQKIVR